MEHATALPDAQLDAHRMVAVVTGATGGIGLEIARQLIAAGATVHVGARDATRGQTVVDDLGEHARLLALDVTDAASVTAAAASVDALDALVNNAGISGDAGGPPSATDADAFRHVYETNVFGVVAVTNAFLPALRRSPHPRIVMVSSGTGSLGWSSGPNPQFPHRTGGAGAAYRSSKTALNAITLFYGQELEEAGFKVNALAPGLRRTNLNARAAAAGGDPAEAATGAVRLALLPDNGPTAGFYSWDGGPAAW